MVRVIPVHNFFGQNVASVEEPTASCAATYMGQEMLLLALTSHCVEVHQLTMSQPKIFTVFPTVDLVHQMLHCNTENYIATVESKYSRDGATVNNFVRIYVNWALGGNQNQAMRARIAGRVTPSSNRLSNSLEMIELPLSGQPTRIACCQATGNLLVATGDTAVLHELKVERQQLSKQKFIDFEARPWSLGFSFSPTRIKIAEDFFMIMDRSNFMVFRLVNQLYEDIDLLSSSNSGKSSSSRKTSSFNVSSSRAVPNETGKASEISVAAGKSSTDASSAFETAELLKAIEQRNANATNANTNKSTKAWNSSSTARPVIDNPTFIDWDRLVSDKSYEQLLVSQNLINDKSQSFCIDLPVLRSESNRPGPISNPYISSAPDLTVVIKTSSPMDGWSENYVVKNLFGLKISEIHKNSKLPDNSEYFTCCVLKPLYLKNVSNAVNVKKCTLRSDKYKSLNRVCCVICTAQEGYLFNCNATTSTTTSCTLYPFTAPVGQIVLEETVLHALTEAGLESYTLRLSHELKNSTEDSPENLLTADFEPVSLIGLRPFMGVQRLLHVNRYIILLTQADDRWTLYTLSLPSPEDLYQDVVNAAINHKTSSPSTYKHLLIEAFTIISLAKDVDYGLPDNLPSNKSKTNTSTAEMELLYRKCCALLADYYINSPSSKDWYLCVPYFKRSRLKPAEVLSQRSITSSPGLATYLTETLMNLKSGAEADALFQVHNIVDMISSTSKKNLIKLIFSSLVLREYATDKLIGILQTLEQDDPTKFALVILCVQADRQDQAEKIVKTIADNCISSMSLTHWHCLFDVTLERQNGHVIATFSELSVILMRQKSLIFADVLVRVIDAGAVSLHQTLQIFLAHLPSRVGRDGHVAAAVLQLFVETYLRNYFDAKTIGSVDTKTKDTRYDYSIVEAFKILVRSYLGKLTQTNVYAIEENRNNAAFEFGQDDDYLFEKFRPIFLDSVRSHTTNTPESHGTSSMKTKRRAKGVRSETLKLQALLASGYLPVECLQEVEEFLKAHKVDGDFTFRLLCAGHVEGTQLLMENCPQAVLQYAKESYTEESEWKYLIQLLNDELSKAENNSEVSSLLDQLLEDTLIHLARTMSLKGLQLLLSNENTTILQRYGDICSQIMHADHVNSMIIGTGQHLLVNINF